MMHNSTFLLIYDYMIFPHSSLVPEMEKVANSINTDYFKL